MKQITTILVFFLTTLICYGQKEHLEPARDFKAFDGVLKEYYDNVFPLLYNGFVDRPYARYTSMPSFGASYAFSIEQTKNKYYIISNNLSESYWYAKNKNKVKLETQKTEIEKSLYITTGKLFQLLAEQTRPEDSFGGIDGVTYFFSTTDINGEIRIGETWSPQDNSLLKRLVEICEKLFALGKGKSTSQAEITNEIDKLINDLQS